MGGGQGRRRSVDAVGRHRRASVARGAVRSVVGEQRGHQRQALAATDAMAVQPIHATDRATTTTRRRVPAAGFAQAIANADDHGTPVRDRTVQHVSWRALAVKGLRGTLEIKEFQTEVFCCIRFRGNRPRLPSRRTKAGDAGMTRRPLLRCGASSLDWTSHKVRLHLLKLF